MIKLKFKHQNHLLWNTEAIWKATALLKHSFRYHKIFHLYNQPARTKPHLLKDNKAHHHHLSRNTIFAAHYIIKRRFDISVRTVLLFCALNASPTSQDQVTSFLHLWWQFKKSDRITKMYFGYLSYYLTNRKLLNQKFKINSTN